MTNTTQHTKHFIIQRSELNNRMDPAFHLAVENIEKNIVEKAKYECKTLLKVCKIVRGRFGHRPRNDPRFYNGDYPFIQTGDVARASDSLKSIGHNQTLNELGLSTSKLFEPRKLLFTIAANIADTAILDFLSCFPDSIVALIPFDEKNVSIDYLNIYIRIIKPFIVDLAPYSAQRNLNNEQLAEVPIILPSIDVQGKVVEKFQKAHKEKQQKEQEAKQLLGNIDTYLLNELGITIPQKDNSLESRMFTVNFSEVSGGRFDPEYYSLNNSLIIEALNNSAFTLDKIKSQYDFVPGYAFSSNDYLESSNCILITIKNISKNSINVTNTTFLPDEFYDKYSTFQINRNDLLIAMTGATIGKVGIYESDKKALLNQRNGVIKSGKMNTYFLMNLLNTSIYQSLILRNAVGGAQPNISERAIMNINIPIPPPEKQSEIANHISDLRTRAKQLQQEAEEILNQAKATIENMILN